MVSKETEDLRKARNDTKSKHLLLNTAASRKRLKDLNGSKRGTIVTQLVTKNFSMNGRGTLALFWTTPPLLMLLDHRQVIDHFLDASTLAALIHHLFIIEIHFLCVHCFANDIHLYVIFQTRWPTQSRCFSTDYGKVSCGYSKLDDR